MRNNHQEQCNFAVRKGTLGQVTVYNPRLKMEGNNLREGKEIKERKKERGEREGMKEGRKVGKKRKKERTQKRLSHR